MKPLFTLDDFRELTKDLPGDTTFSVCGDIPLDITVVSGRCAEGYYNQQFNQAAKGKSKAIAFVHNAELADGSVEKVKI